MRVIVTFLLLVVAPSAWAEWVKVGNSSRTAYFVLSNETVYYFDLATITKDGNFRRVGKIHDLSDKGSQGERSVLASVEYDCAEKRMRTLKATGRSLRMARGEIIPLSRVIGDWITLRPGKDEEIFFNILNIVCARD